jgi:hypothetical protein
VRRENKSEEQRERKQSDLARSQNTISTHLANQTNPCKHLATTPKQLDHLATTQRTPNLAENGGKIKGVKKVSNYDEICVEKLKKQPIFLY